MPRVTRSSSPSASERRGRARARSLALVGALALAGRRARAQDRPDVRACIDAATLGQTLRDAGKLVGARDAFRSCAVESCPLLVRADCGTWASQVTATIPTLVVGARDPAGNDLLDVRVLADGVLLAERVDGRPRELDPGPHRLRFERDATPATTVDIVLRAGESARAVMATVGSPPPVPPVPPVPPAEPRAGGSPVRGRAIALVTLGGVALVAAGGLAFFGLRAGDEAEDLRTRCAPRCTPDDTRALRTDLTIADVAMGIGIASLGALVVVALLPRSRAEAAWVGVRPVGSGTGVVLGARY